MYTLTMMVLEFWDEFPDGLVEFSLYSLSKGLIDKIQIPQIYVSSAVADSW
jgi:hypothetical protein